MFDVEKYHYIHFFYLYLWHKFVTFLKTIRIIIKILQWKCQKGS